MAVDTKHLITTVMSALASGDRQPLFDALADDATWQWMGVLEWSKTFHGKSQIIDTLFGGVDRTLDSSGSTTTVTGIYAEGETVVVEHRGTNTTPDGRHYDNNYCWVLTLRDDRITSVREYMDTQLVSETFSSDPSRRG